MSEPFSEDHSITPRAGTGHEVFLFNTVPVPPSNADDVDNQAGPEPTLIIPADGNVASDVDLGFVGSITDETNLNDIFPLKIKMVDLSKQSIIDFDITKGVRADGTRAKENTYAAFGALIAEDRIGRSTVIVNRERSVRRVNTPRMVVLFNSDNEAAGDYRGVRNSFKRFPASSIYLPDAEDMATASGAYGGNAPSADPYMMPGSHASFVYDEKNDRLCVFYLYRYDDTVNNVTPVYIHGLAFKQGLNTWNPAFGQGDAADFFVDLGISDKLFNSPLDGGATLFEYNSKIKTTGLTDTDYAPYQMAAVYFREKIYCIISEPEELLFATNAHIGSGNIFVTVFSEGEDIWDRHRAVAGPLWITREQKTKILNMQAAAIEDRVCLALGTRLEGAGSDPDLYNVQFSSTGDLANWGTSDEESDLGARTLASLEARWRSPGTEDGPGQTVSPAEFYGPDNEVGFFTSKNQIYKTEDGGETWSLVFEPEPFFNSISYVKISGESGGNLHVWAYSVTKGVMFKSENSGESWFIHSAIYPEGLVQKGYTQYFKQDETVEDTGYVTPYTLPWGASITDMAWKDISVGWACGFGNQLFMTEDAGETWAPVYAFTGQSSLYKMAYLGEDTGDVIAVFGGLYNAATPGGGGAALVHITGSSPNFTPTSNIIETFNNKTAPNDDWAFCLNGSYYDPVTLYICGEKGYIAEVTVSDMLTNSPDFTVTQICTDTTSVIFDCVYRYDTTDDDSFNDIIAGARNGILWRAYNYDVGLIDFPSWEHMQLGIKQTHSVNSVTPVGGPGVNNYVVTVSNTAVYRGRLDLQNRKNPSIISVPETSEFILSCLNLDKKQIEIWKSYDKGERFEQIPVQFAVSGVPDTDLKGSRAPLTRMADGSIMCQVLPGQSGTYLANKVTFHYISYDYGETWEALRLNGPIYNIDATAPYIWDSEDISQETGVPTGVSLMNYGGNRIFSLMQNTNTPALPEKNRYALFSLYEWELLTSYLTLVPGVPQDIGVDDLRVVFTGIPHVQDEWTVYLRHRYDVRNVAVETPSIFYRSQNDDANVELIWDRELYDDTELGAGRRWYVDAFALFRTNFENAYIEITGPDYDDLGWPTDPGDLAEVTRFELSSVVEVGAVPQSRILRGIFRDESKSWIPHQFQSSNTKFYLKTDVAGASIRVFRILDNTENSLILEQDMTTLLGFTNTEVTYKILTDRMFSMGTTPSRGSNAMVPPVLNTKYSNPKLIKLIIPAQATAQGYFEVGTTIFGTQTPIKRDWGHSQLDRSRFSRGFSWQPVTFSREEVGFNGVSAVENFNRTTQRWSLQYNNIIWWDRDYTLYGILSDPTKAFVFCFDHNRPESSYLVRLEESPSIQNTSGDRYDFNLQIREVV